MPTPSPSPKPRPNPFFVLLLLSSTAFAVTAWVGYVGPLLAQAPARPGAAEPGADPQALADWFNRRGTTALAIEFAVMFATAILAMATDRHFAPKATPRGPGPDAP